MKLVRPFSLFLVLLVASNLPAATLPGFRIEKLGAASGFVSSIASDSQDRLFYTTTAGNIYRFEGGVSSQVAHVNTYGVSNAGLLGMAFIDDRTAAVHYTISSSTDPETILEDVVSRIDLVTGAETVLHRFSCDIQVEERGVSPEHHGGNPTVGPDGSIYVGIGDYGGGLIASLPQWNGGKIFRIYPDGVAIRLALGFRNPFDLIWDDANHRAIVPENGAAIGDQINIVKEGADQNFGWPFVAGTYDTPAGITPPVYIFTRTVAPTGTIALRGANAYMRKGMLLTAFVTKAIYWFADLDAPRLADPVALIDHETGPLIDVTETPDGEIYFASGTALYHLDMPRKGDCNGDGLIEVADLVALDSELADAPEKATNAQNGAWKGSWGCDADGDGTIDIADRGALIQMIGARRRAVRVGR